MGCAAHNAAHHDELFHIIEHTDITHRAQSDQMNASDISTQSPAQNNARARIKQSTNSHIPVWRAAADMASTSSWGATDGSKDGSWPTAPAKPIPAADLLDKIREVQDRFREELAHMRHDEQRCNKVQQFLERADKLQKDVQSEVINSRDALDELHTIKVWSHDQLTSAPAERVGIQLRHHAQGQAQHSIYTSAL